MNLQHMHVLVTRPRPFGEILCEKIREVGGDAHYFQTIEIAPVMDPMCEQHIRQLNQFDWVIFISPQAVLYSIATIQRYWPTWPANTKIAAIGASTANHLEAAHMSVTEFPKDDWRSEGLLALPAFQTLANKKIALICGQGGREWLQESLTARGAEVIRLEIYARQLPIIDVTQYSSLFHAHLIDIMVCTSNEGLKNLLLLLKEQVLQVALLVVSERMAEQAKTLGFNHIVLAKNASHDSILEALFDYKRMMYGKQKG